VLVTRGALEPGDRRGAFLNGAPAVGGFGETRPRPLEQLRVSYCRRQISFSHPADRPSAHPEQIADLRPPLLARSGPS
jgi:hypothetical protein